MPPSSLEASSPGCRSLSSRAAAAAASANAAPTSSLRDDIRADAALYVSLVLSVLSITYSTATKLYELLARDSDKAGTASARYLGRPVAALYFASDAVVRGVAVALLFTELLSPGGQWMSTHRRQLLSKTVQRPSSNQETSL